MYTEQYHSSSYFDSYPIYQQTSSNVYFSSEYDTTYFNIETDRRTTKRKFQEETIKSPDESEVCRVCDDISSGYHFGVFTCEACKGFFRRYSKKSNILQPCSVRCLINKTNRNNCAACRFDKCKCVGMALDKIRFGKPPKIFRSSSSSTPSIKLEPTHNDFQLMLKLLECYQSFNEYEHQPITTTTMNTQSSVIFQFCHRLASIVMDNHDYSSELVYSRLKRHESAIKFLITGENNPNLFSWSKEPQAWMFAHNERWRLILILLILSFDDEQQLIDLNNSIIDKILRLFELEYDQEKDTQIFQEKNFKFLKAQFLLRFIDMMSYDMIYFSIHSY